MVAIMGLLFGGLALYAGYRHFLAQPLVIPAQGMPLIVPPGSSVANLARQLEDQGVIGSALLLRVYARLSGTATRIKTGEYLIASGTRPAAFMEQLVEGRVIQYALTIVEGWTFRQMLAAVRGHEKLEHTLDGLDDEVIMAHLGAPGEHPEGRFFPDTYYFPLGTSDLAFLKRAFNTMQEQLGRSWATRVDDLPLRKPYEALILASIIEKETGLNSERREIAGVFIRRLRKGMPLQTDPTVIYALGEDFDGDLRRRDLKVDSPYNTYENKGLPPTPIALPGQASLDAAVNPAPGDSLYFVADGSGGHVFSNTLREHNRAVRRYQLNRARSE
jgi:UPF0755 protein